jgi:hypothetical protein
VTISLEGGSYARFRPNYLDADSYKEFQQATEGTRYVRELRTKLAPLDKVPGILVRLRECRQDNGEPLFDAVLQPEIIQAMQDRTASQWLDLKSAQARIEKIDAELHARTGFNLYPFQKTGSQWLTLRQAALLADEQGTGKDQAVSEPVLTSTGWRKMGDLKVGDFVIGSDGGPTEVLGVFPQGRRQQFRVTLTDGTSTRCGAEHLWLVSPGRSFTSVNSRPRVKTLREMMERGLRSAQGYSHWFVPVLTAPIEFSDVEEDAFLHPYLIGALIANGSLAHAVVGHTGTEEQRDVIRRLMPAGYRLSPTKGDEYTYRFVLSERSSGRPRNEVRRHLTLLGLQGKRSWEKRIPNKMLFQSVASRKELLAGLLDNDGTVCSRDGTQVEYNTSSRGLADDVAHLIRSLGGLAWMSKRWPKYTYKGEYLEGRTDYRIRMRLMFNPFRVISKVHKYVLRTKYPPAHAIEKVEPCGVEKSVCIRVAAKDQLYVTNDFILTHNTIQTIVAIPANVPIVVVAPAVAKGVWLSEVGKWRPQLRVTVLQGRESFRWPSDNEMVVTNYDILPSIHDKAGKKGRRCDGYLPAEPCPGCRERQIVQATNVVTIMDGHLPECKGLKKERRFCDGCHPLLDSAPEGTVVIYDEAQYLKNFKANRTRQARAIAKAARDKRGRTWLLSGTPLENEPKDLWSVFQAAGIAEEAFGTWKTFVALFRGKPTPHGYTWGLPGEEIKERLQRVSLRRMRIDVLPQLPSKTWQVIPVDVDRKALLECERFLERHGGIAKITELLEKDKIGFEVMSSVRKALATAKIPAMLMDIEEQEKLGEPYVVFSAHRAPIDILAKRQGWAVITGDTSAAKKSEIEKAFQDGKLKGVGCTIRAGGVAITLTRASRMLFVDRDFKSTANQQAEDRICRIGADKKRGVLIRILEADHILDRRVTEILLRKTALIEASVDAASVGEDSPTNQELEEYVKRMQLEIDSGKAVRRAAATEEEKRALDDLHTFAFEAKNDERLAFRLAEEAVTIGLSDTQWTLAAQVAKMGQPPKVKTRPAVVDSSETDETTTVVRKTGTAAKMRLHKSDSKDKSKSEKKQKQEEPEASLLVAGVIETLKKMTRFERLELLEYVDDVYCEDCLNELPPRGKKHECPDDEDDDDDGDDSIEDDDLDEDELDEEGDDR